MSDTRKHLTPAEEAAERGQPHFDLAAWEALRQWGRAHRAALSQTREGPETPPSPARDDERAVTHAAMREQAERSSDTEARGWGQSWDEQEHAQERGRDR